MESTRASEWLSRTTRPTLASQCANVLVVRGYVTADKESVVATMLLETDIIPEAATSRLLQQGLVAPENRAAVSEFIKRTLRRFG